MFILSANFYSVMTDTLNSSDNFQILFIVQKFLLWNFIGFAAKDFKKS